MVALQVVSCMLHCRLSGARCTKDALEPLLPSLSPSDTVSFFEPLPSPAESASSKPKCSAEPTDEGEHGDGDSHGPGRPAAEHSEHGSRRRGGVSSTHGDIKNAQTVSSEQSEMGRKWDYFLRRRRMD